MPDMPPPITAMRRAGYAASKGMRVSVFFRSLSGHTTRTGKRMHSRLKKVGSAW
jgi:hypothetical protein